MRCASVSGLVFLMASMFNPPSRASLLMCFPHDIYDLKGGRAEASHSERLKNATETFRSRSALSIDLDMRHRPQIRTQVNSETSTIVNNIGQSDGMSLVQAHASQKVEVTGIGVEPLQEVFHFQIFQGC
jgi:hypothetical protein